MMTDDAWTALATLVTTWFTLADRRWRSRYPALTSVSLLSLGRRNATTGGSGNNLANVSLFSIPPWLSRLRVAIRRRKCPTIQPKNEWTQKWPYERDARARESTLCVARATRGSKNSLFFVFDSLYNLDCGQWYIFWIYQSHPMSARATQSVDSRARASLS
jgi:hypothetical protein